MFCMNSYYIIILSIIFYNYSLNICLCSPSRFAFSKPHESEFLFCKVRNLEGGGEGDWRAPTYLKYMLNWLILADECNIRGQNNIHKNLCLKNDVLVAIKREDFRKDIHMRTQCSDFFRQFASSWQRPQNRNRHGLHFSHMEDVLPRQSIRLSPSLYLYFWTDFTRHCRSWRRGALWRIWHSFEFSWTS